MMLLLGLLLAIALLLTLAHAMERLPLWPAVFVVIVVNLIAFYGR